MGVTGTRFSNPDYASLLNSPSWSHCEGQIKRFEEAWRRGPAPNLGDYLDADEPLRRALLIELVHIDLEFRLRAGEPVRAEEYWSRYPELGADRAVCDELSAAEREMRRRFAAGSDTFDGLAASARPAPPERPAVPNYEVLAEVGRGGMGVVYKARDPRLDRHVALKFLPPEYARDPDRLARFLREARTASALNHPHICTVHALGEHQGRPFLVLEFIEGITLHSLAARRPAVREAARLIGQAAQALAAAHAAGVTHRDVKPENIMVRPDGYVKVLDFGLARRLPTLDAPAATGGRDTDPGMLIGTAAYMSPEQARGRPADSASDIFSLGVVLYQLVTGQHPFEADSVLGTLHAIANRSPLAPSRLNPEVPAALEGLIEAMLHKDARLRPTAAEVAQALTVVTGRSVAGPGPTVSARLILHREPELATLRAALAAADGRHGSFVCVAGEPGIGKTTLVEDFLGEVTATGAACLVGRGHCSERLADTEAYLPVIDALGDLLRGDTGATVAGLMKVVAPTWYAQVAPASANAAAPSRAPSQQALLREFVHLLQELSRRSLVVLFFDDVHWADAATVDLLAYLGRHCPGLRVLVVATYRPTELLLGPHPFHAVQLELQGRGSCTELSLGFLGRDEVAAYLAMTFPGHDFPPDFADLVHARTEGSPLFMADLLRYLRERGVLAEVRGCWSLARELPDLRRELPASVRSMIQRKLDHVAEEDRLLLAAASVQGAEFDSAVVARALGRDGADVEERLQHLDRVHGLVRLVREYEFPDRTLTQRYAFVHALYQQALYAQLPPTRRAALAQGLADALERHHGDGSAVAAELACLYEVGRDFARAARQFTVAVQNAARVFAHREAVALARRGLRLLEGLPESPERAARELPLQTALGLQLQVTEGFAAPEVEHAYSRARALCPHVPDSPLFSVLWGLWLFSKVRSELAKAQHLAEELRALADRLGDPALALQAQQALAVTSLCRGEPTATLGHMEQAAAIYDPARHQAHSSQFGQDPGVACKAFGAVALWLIGRPDEARRQAGDAIRLSHQLAQPSSQALALHFAAMVHQLCRDHYRAQVCAETCGVFATEHGYSFWQAGSAVLTGAALAARGDGEAGIGRLRRGLLDWEATGSVTYRTYFLGLLAEALGRQGETAEADRVLTEALALAERTGEGLYAAELHRLRGEVILSGAGPPERAEEGFRRAAEVAHRQGALALELRAVTSLVRLDDRSGRRSDSRDRLADVASRFTEGLATPDLTEARALLEK